MHLDAELPKEIIPLGVEFFHRLGVIPVDTRRKHGVCFPKFEFLLTTQLATLGFLELVNVGENDVADGLLRAVDVAEVLDVHAIVGCFDRFPGHLLDDRVGDNLLAVGRHLAKWRFAVVTGTAKAKRGVCFGREGGDNDDTENDIQCQREDE